jgi:hypothetical protein
MTTFNDAITAAGTVAAKSDATQAEVDAAKDTLNAAITAFTGAIQAGTKKEVDITIGFNYGAITISGSDGSNVIYKDVSRTPNSITLSAITDYTNVKWYIDGDTAAGTGNSITLNADDYSARTHSITFAGTRSGKLYSQELPFMVKN